MQKRNYIIAKIDDVIADYKKFAKGKTVTVFSSMYSYDAYDFKPDLKLEFFDVKRNRFGFMKESDVEKLLKLLPKFKDANTIISACDHGSGRSPAIGMAIAYLLWDKEEVKRIKEEYQFANIDVFDFIVANSKVK
jgi:predicted protein tyrosine phosphatase